MKVAIPEKVATLEETREALGLLIDSANRYLYYRTVHMPPALKVDALVAGIQDLRDRIRRLYDDLGGVDVWEGDN